MKQIKLVTIENGADNHGLRDRVAVYSFEVANHVKKEDILDLLKETAKEYCLTEEGQKNYDENCCCFNIGDFFACVPNNILHRHGIYSIQPDSETITLDFNTQLVEEEEIFAEDFAEE